MSKQKRYPTNDALLRRRADWTHEVHYDQIVGDDEASQRDAEMVQFFEDQMEDVTGRESRRRKGK